MIAPLRVLVADDDEFILEIIVELLEQLGLTDIHRAQDGHGVLACVDDPQTRPQLILCDVDMQGMDGIECLRHLAARRFAGAVIVMSGSGARMLSVAAELVQEHKLHFLAALLKPIDFNELRQALEKLTLRGPSAAPSVQGALLSPDAIREGLRADAVQIYLQPKITLAKRAVIGAEALLRWRSPSGGIVPPVAVIPVAEAHGLIDALLHCVFRQAVACLAQWQAQGLNLTVAVNVSMDNLAALDLPETLAAMARDAGADVRGIVLEITESRLMLNPIASLEVISRLRLKGFRLSIDDFGTGYASLEKLSKLPVDELKIDQSFVRGSSVDVASRVILESSIRLGHSLGMRVVAEGAESFADLELLNDLGCDQVQGYVIAKPMPADRFLPWLQDWARDHAGVCSAHRTQHTVG